MRAKEADAHLAPDSIGALQADIEQLCERIAMLSQALTHRNADRQVANELERTLVRLTRDASQAALSLGMSMRAIV